jgi:magnesium chelatase family protein
MQVAVKALSSSELISTNPEIKPKDEKNSAQLQEQVLNCYARQFERQKKLNAELEHKSLEKICLLNNETRSFMQTAMDRLNFSARVYHRILKLSRTIADVEQQEVVTITHLSEAMAFRGLDRLRFE